MGKGANPMSRTMCAMVSCVRCARSAVYRVKTVGGEYEAVCCGMHLPETVQIGLSKSVAQQGVRVQVTYAQED
jgi:hypothetical protein